MQIYSKSSDFIWNYSGLFFKMAGQLLLLPMVLSMLQDDLVGLWYVFLAVNSFVTTFQDGFGPTFGRNVAFCWSGSTAFLVEGAPKVDGGEVNFPVLRALIGSCKRIYRMIAFAVLIGAASLGSLYVVSVSEGLTPAQYTAAWVVFCIGVFVNVLYTYWDSFLRGIGDFAGVNKAIIVSSLTQIAVIAVMLLLDLGLLSCAVGFLVQGLVFRFMCKLFFFRAEGMREGLGGAPTPTRSEVCEIGRALSVNAFKDTAVSLANYAVTTSNTLLCAAFIGLSESSVFSVTLQVLNACVNLSTVALTTYSPSMQSAYVNGNKELGRKLAGKCLVSFYALYSVGFTLVLFVCMPVLGLFKPGIDSMPLLTISLGLYLLLWRHHSLCATLISNTNHVPYATSFVFSAVLGVALSVVFLILSGGSVLGLVAGQAIAQLVYNNWKWPHEAGRLYDTTYPCLLRAGVKAFTARFKRSR